MDRVIMPTHASQYISWWWPVGALIVGLIAYVVSHMTFDRPSLRHTLGHVIGVMMMVTALCLSLANMIANSKNYEAQNPSMNVIASRLHLHLLPSQQGSDIVENDHSLRIYLNDAGERFTGCYVERSKIDAVHNSFRLMCEHDGNSTPAHS